MAMFCFTTLTRLPDLDTFSRSLKHLHFFALATLTHLISLANPWANEWQLDDVHVDQDLMSPVREYLIIPPSYCS